MSKLPLSAYVMWATTGLWAGGWWIVLTTTPTTCVDGPCANDTASTAFTALVLGTPPLVLLALVASACAVVARVRRSR